MNSHETIHIDDLYMSPRQCQLMDDQQLSPLKPIHSFTPMALVYIPETQHPTPGTNMPQLNINSPSRLDVQMCNIFQGQHINVQDQINIRAANRWTRAEDEALRTLVLKYKIHQWEFIQKQLALTCPRPVPRTREQCYQRWYRVINPQIKKGKWSFEEDVLLLNVIRNKIADGKIKWVEVAEQIPQRTDIQVRYRALKIKKWLVQCGIDEAYIQ